MYIFSSPTIRLMWYVYIPPRLYFPLNKPSSQQHVHTTSREKKPSMDMYCKFPVAIDIISNNPLCLLLTEKQDSFELIVFDYESDLSGKSCRQFPFLACVQTSPFPLLQAILSLTAVILPYNSLIRFLFIRAYIFFRYLAPFGVLYISSM